MIVQLHQLIVYTALLITDRGAKQELMSLFTVNYGSSQHKYKRFNLREAPLHAQLYAQPAQSFTSNSSAILSAHHFADRLNLGRTIHLGILKFISVSVAFYNEFEIFGKNVPFSVNFGGTFYGQHLIFLALQNRWCAILLIQALQHF